MSNRIRCHVPRSLRNRLRPLPGQPSGPVLYEALWFLRRWRGLWYLRGTCRIDPACLGITEGAINQPQRLLRARGGDAEFPGDRGGACPLHAEERLDDMPLKVGQYGRPLVGGELATPRRRTVGIHQLPEEVRRGEWPQIHSPGDVAFDDGVVVGLHVRSVRARRSELPVAFHGEDGDGQSVT